MQNRHQNTKNKDIQNKYLLGHTQMMTTTTTTIKTKNTKHTIERRRRICLLFWLGLMCNRNLNRVCTYNSICVLSEMYTKTNTHSACTIQAFSIGVFAFISLLIKLTQRQQENTSVFAYTMNTLKLKEIIIILNDRWSIMT